MLREGVVSLWWELFSTNYMKPIKNRLSRTELFWWKEIVEVTACRSFGLPSHGSRRETTSSFMARLYTMLLDGMGLGGTQLRWDSSEPDYGVWAEGRANECLMQDGHTFRDSSEDLQRYNRPQALLWSCY